MYIYKSALRNLMNTLQVIIRTGCNARLFGILHSEEKSSSAIILAKSKF